MFYQPYINGHLELQRDITLIELASSPYLIVKSICLVDMNVCKVWFNSSCDSSRYRGNKALQMDIRTL